MAKIAVFEKLKSGGRLATGSGAGTSEAVLGAPIEAQVVQAHGTSHFLGHILIVKPKGGGSSSEVVNQGSCVPLGGD
ncbi:MAG: hypothetical protein JNM39_08810 [Bdellovibrionaceae bacterium]|nr:hypothetical protein [Pseudobdellovibrionaceae bacterium]